MASFEITQEYIFSLGLELTKINLIVNVKVKLHPGRQDLLDAEVNVIDTNKPHASALATVKLIDEDTSDNVKVNYRLIFGTSSPCNFSSEYNVYINTLLDPSKFNSRR